MNLQELKKNTLNNKALNLSLIEIIGILSCDNKEYIEKVMRNKVQEKSLELNKAFIAETSQEDLENIMKEFDEFK